LFNFTDKTNIFIFANSISDFIEQRYIIRVM
jgi:hypothetical protein